ncbi:MAG: hypothetical protein ACK5RJ_13710 [Burkholderiales bacterium]
MTHRSDVPRMLIATVYGWWWDAVVLTRHSIEGAAVPALGMLHPWL